jgi:hypothetical protein
VSKSQSEKDNHSFEFAGFVPSIVRGRSLRKVSLLCGLGLKKESHFQKSREFPPGSFACASRSGISSEVVEKSSEMVETLVSAKPRIALPKRIT